MWWLPELVVCTRSAAGASCRHVGNDGGAGQPQGPECPECALVIAGSCHGCGMTARLGAWWHAAGKKGPAAGECSGISQGQKTGPSPGHRLWWGPGSGVLPCGLTVVGADSVHRPAGWAGLSVYMVVGFSGDSCRCRGLGWLLVWCPGCGGDTGEGLGKDSDGWCQ